VTRKSILHAFLSLLLLFILLATGCSAVPVYAASSWNVQIVDENSYLYDDHCPIVVDSNNNPHILYSGFTHPTNILLQNMQAGTIHPGTAKK
jgi:hypothetical protein